MEPDGVCEKGRGECLLPSGLLVTLQGVPVALLGAVWVRPLAGAAGLDEIRRRMPVRGA
jgi:hypothetical protein